MSLVKADLQVHDCSIGIVDSNIDGLRPWDGAFACYLSMLYKLQRIFVIEYDEKIFM
jgi:hypothetical protein